MASQQDHFINIVKLFLPTEIFDYFEIANVESEDRTVHIYLDEMDVKPTEYLHEKLTSKGFTEASVIQDFPLRDKAVYLHVRRRRWLIESTQKVVGRDWDLVAKGTRYTKGFATFLKGIFGYLPHQ